MRLPPDISWSSWFAMGCIKTLVIAACGGAVIACVRQRDLAARLWLGLSLLLPLALFSGLLPVSWKALPPASRIEATLLTTVPARSGEMIAVDEPIPETVPTPTKQADDVQAIAKAAPTEAAALSQSQMVAALWIAGAFLSLVPSIFAWCLSRRLKSSRAPEPMFSQWREIAGTTADFVPLRLSPDISTPGIASLIRPVVLLPDSASDWPEDRLHSVLRHELHHLRRRDLMCRWLGRAVRAVLWFHPATWWVQSRLVIAQERAADEAVVAGGVPAADYAGHLLESVADARCFPGLAMARRSQIGGRIHLLLARRRAPARIRRIAEGLMAASAAAATVFLAILGFGAPEMIRAADETRLVATPERRADILDRRGEIIATSDPAKMPEVLRAKPPLRWYPHHEAVGHLSGLVQPAEAGGLAAIEKSGLEANETLQQGKALQSTIDLRAQRLAWAELDAMKRCGSIVVMDPRRGEVVAMASWPAIDPNAFADGATPAELNAWKEDEGQPLLNRALALDAPASFAKLPVALGAAANDLSGRQYFCGALFRSGRIQVPDSHPLEREIGLRTALMRSSNVYFAQLGLELGHEKFRNIWSDLSLPLAAGTMWQAPAAKWYSFDPAAPNEVDLSRAAFGYGTPAVSVLDQAAMLSTLASGVIRQPVFLAGEPAEAPIPVGQRGVDHEELALIRQALIDSVNGAEPGAGSAAKLESRTVAGLPGTSRLQKDGRYVTNRYVASFTAYAPAEEPRYVVAVRLESGAHENERFYGGPTAGPIAARLLKELLKLEE